MVSYEDIAPTGMKNPETMFIIVGVLLGVAFIGFIIWSVYQALS